MEAVMHSLLAEVMGPDLKNPGPVDVKLAYGRELAQRLVEHMEDLGADGLRIQVGQHVVAIARESAAAPRHRQRPRGPAVCAENVATGN